MNYMQAVQHVFFLDRLGSFEYVWASSRVEFAQVEGAQTEKKSSSPPCLLLAGGKHLVTSGMMMYLVVKGSLGGETSVLRTFRMSGKELVKERVSQRKS